MAVSQNPERKRQIQARYRSTILLKMARSFQARTTTAIIITDSSQHISIVRQPQSGTILKI